MAYDGVTPRQIGYLPLISPWSLVKMHVKPGPNQASPDRSPKSVSLAPNKPNLDNLAGDIWKSAERLRGKFKAYEYQNVVLPIIVIRRLECVLIKWREDKAAEVLAKRPKLSPKELAKLVKGLEINTAPFSNKTDWTLHLPAGGFRLPQSERRLLAVRRRRPAGYNYRAL